ncbi:MAG: AmmeMemoRadiSam system protein B [Myxococcota bacterium]
MSASGGLRIRPPAVAAQFYPGEADVLCRTVDGLLAATDPDGATAPKALIVPHAGYVYSGPVAASAYARLRAHGGPIERVVLIGPAHRVALHGLAVPGVDAFRTPLGDVPIDAEALQKVLALPQVCRFDTAHATEHSLEVQLPFLQRALGRFRLAPLVAGDATEDEVAQVLEQLWGGSETLIVVSSDLSHYLDLASARRVDAETTRAIERLDSHALGYDSACGRIPIQGLLACARRHHLRCRALDVRTSGDTAGPTDRVVGYGAYALE